jgi:hypothetical protein
MKTRRSIAEVLSSLDTQAAFHREREAYHAAQAAAHQERQSVHAAELAEITRRLELFRAAAGEALELSERAAPAASKETKGAAERFGPATLAQELNLRFGGRLRRPVSAAQVSVLLRRMSEKGRIHLVRQGRPRWEALYVREAGE